MKRVLVAAGVIRRGDQILIAQRLADQHQGGLWEFPGGKVEPGETILQALMRELHEELGITVQHASPLICIEHDYPDKQICLDVWEVTAFQGEPSGKEGQPLAWVSPSGLSHYVFPAANLPIVSAAQLPPYYAISPDVNSVAVLLEWADMQLAKGLRLLLLRAPQLSAKKYVEVAKNILEKCTILRAELMLHGAMDVWQQLPDAHGFHLSAQQLKLLTSRPVENHLWLAASVHNQQELAQAAQVGVDFVTLSPVQKTLSHPDAKPLGWDVFTVLTRQATVPVYALGGLTISDLEKARQSGAQGVAAIRGL